MQDALAGPANELSEQAAAEQATRATKGVTTAAGSSATRAAIAEAMHRGGTGAEDPTQPDGTAIRHLADRDRGARSNELAPSRSSGSGAMSLRARRSLGRGLASRALPVVPPLAEQVERITVAFQYQKAENAALKVETEALTQQNRALRLPRRQPPRTCTLVCHQLSPYFLGRNLCPPERRGHALVLSVAEASIQPRERASQSLYY